MPTATCSGTQMMITSRLLLYIEAVEALAPNIEPLFGAMFKQVGGTYSTYHVVITADHLGTCDQMFELDQEIMFASRGALMVVKGVKTSRTLTAVPFILVGKDADKFEKRKKVYQPSRSVGLLVGTLRQLS